MKETSIFMNKPVNLNLSILEKSKMLEFWYNYDFVIKAKLCYMDANSFTVYIKQKTFT